MINLKTYENFSGRIKYTKTEDLDTQEVIELINILFELKPSLPDEFPKADLSKLIRNEVTYLSDDDRFNIKVEFSENDTYVNKEGELVTGKYKTIFKVNIVRNIEDDEASTFKLSEVKEYILLTSQLVEKTYDKVQMLVHIEDNKLSIEEFEKLSDNTELNEVTFLIKIL
jgi:lipopolysaccharide export LptBFGC system permease protein LptF